MLELVWDAENDKHITQRHGVTREQVGEALSNLTVQRGVVTRNGETRVRLLGSTNAGLVLFLVVTSIRPGTIRAVTAFPAKRKLRAVYEKYCGGLP